MAPRPATGSRTSRRQKTSRRGAARSRAREAKLDTGPELRGAATLAALGIAGLALLGAAARLYPPFDTFRSLWIHLGAVMILGGGVLLILRAPRRGLATAAFGAFFALLPLKTAFQDAQPLADAAGRPLKVLTFNAFIHNRQASQLAAMLLDSDYDFVAIQEGATLWDHFPRLDEGFRARAGCETPERCDLVLLSRLPLDDVRWTPYDTRPHRLVTATISLGDREVGIAATHLTKPHHDGVQRYEGYRLIRALRNLPDDAVLMGDFNAAPWSDLLEWVREESGMRIVAGYRPTAPARLGPLAIPIDHVLVRGGMGVSRIDRLPGPLGSNHFGVEADLSIAGAPR